MRYMYYYLLNILKIKHADNYNALSFYEECKLYFFRQPGISN